MLLTTSWSFVGYLFKCSPIWPDVQPGDPVRCLNREARVIHSPRPAFCPNRRAPRPLDRNVRRTCHAACRRWNL